MVRKIRGQISSAMANQREPADLAASLVPRLLIDGRTSTADGIDPAYKLLGLSLLERTVRAARRSGYGRVVVLAERRDIVRFRDLLARIVDVELGEAPI